MAESDLDLAMKVLADQRAVIDMRDATIAKLDTQIAQLKVQVADLEKALCEQFGAHGVLVTQYCNPKLSDTARRQAAAAAIGYEKAKPHGPATAQPRFRALSASRNGAACKAPGR
jgi:hypothetical protein